MMDVFLWLPSAIDPMETVHVASGTTMTITPREMTRADIRQAIADYRNGAKIAEDAGFDGVQLHRCFCRHRPGSRVFRTYGSHAGGEPVREIPPQRDRVLLHGRERKSQRNGRAAHDRPGTAACGLADRIRQ